MKILMIFSISLIVPNVYNENIHISQDECMNLRDSFGNASAEFNFCAIENSKPIKICQKCINSYINVVNTYNNMSKLSVNSTTCLDVFVNQDRLQILNSIYSSSVDLWNRAKCYDCFLMENGTQTAKKSETFYQFEKLYQTFHNCVDINENDLCPSCMKDYLTLSEYYTKISDVNERISYCIDIVDIMNGTWTFWSFNCCKFRKHNEYAFIGISITILILTVVFYVVLQFFGEKNAPLIMKQTRFAESINSLRQEMEDVST